MKKKLIVEFLGTFFLMYVAASSIIGQQPLAALAIGAALMIAIYAGAAVSGGHFNPIVSLAHWRRGKLGTSELPQYIGVQIVAAALAAWLSQVVQDVYVNAFVTATFDAAAKARRPWELPIVLSEFIPSFMLVYISLQLTATKKLAGNPFFGLIIGVTASIGIIVSYSVSGGLLNPALSVGICMLGLKKWIPGLLLLWLGQFAGGFAAAEVFHRTSADGDPPATVPKGGDVHHDILPPPEPDHVPVVKTVVPPVPPQG